MMITRAGDARLSRRGGILGGCLVVLAILLILAIAGGVYVSMNWRAWTADWTVQGVEQMLSQSDLPEEQRSAVMVEVQGLADDFKAGDVTLDELGKIANELIESPIIPVAAVYGTRKAYFEESGLTEEEKANFKPVRQSLLVGVCAPSRSCVARRVAGMDESAPLTRAVQRGILNVEGDCAPACRAV